PHGPIHLKKGQDSGYDRPVSWIYVFIAFRQGGAMGLFLILLWCAAVTGPILRYNSRFGVFNSRLGPNKFPFSPLRELADKDLICLAVFGAKTALTWNNRKIPGSTGMTWNL